MSECHGLINALTQLFHFLILRPPGSGCAPIRLSENDLYELKRKGLENGVPYQNIIQMLVHQYTSNKIHLDVS